MVLSFVFPLERAQPLFAAISGVVIHVGRYVLFPLLFFKIVSSIVHHKKGLRYTQLHIYLLLLSLAITAILASLGSAVVFLFTPPRIPLIYQAVPSFSVPALTDILKEIFPTNFFLVFSGSGDFVLPLVVAAFIIGYTMRIASHHGGHLPEITTKLSEIFTTINGFFINIMGLGTVALSAFFVINIRLITDIGIYLQLVLILLVETVIIIFGIYPLIARLLKVGYHSYTVLWQLLIPALVGAISGDSYLATPILLRSLNREYPHRGGALAHIVTHGTIFTKPGTALVTITSFLVILQSYSALGIPFTQVLWFLLLVVVLSPIVSAYPSRGVIVFLALLTSIYQRGAEEAYFVLVPIAVILIGIAVFIDTITTGYIGHIVLQKILHPHDHTTPTPSEQTDTPPKKTAHRWRPTRTIIPHQ